MMMELKANDHGGFLNFSGEDYVPVYIMDRMYKIFLEHLRKDGKSYILEMEHGNNGLPVFVKYEKEDELSNFLLLEDAPISSGRCNFGRKGRFKTKKKCICRKSEVQSSEIVEFCGPLSNQVQNMLVADNAEQFRSFENRSTDSLTNQAERNRADDSYQEFLSCLKIEDGLMVMEYNSIKVIYEASKTSRVTCFDGKGSFPLQSFDSTQQAVFLKPENEAPICSDNRELVLYENNTDADDPDVVIYEADGMPIVPLEDSISSSFDSKLMAVLSLPYDEQEHEQLWEHANLHKPVVRHRDLRNQSKSFSTGQMGFSYLDHFPDLARKLENSEPQEALNLLRGLFFWLKNLCHEGAYQPWMPASSKTIEVLDLDKMIHLGE